MDILEENEREEFFRLKHELETLKKQLLDAKLVKELIKRLEIRKEQLLGLNLGYKVHSGHHLRDVMTTLSVLRNEPSAEALLKNMPQKRD